MSQKLTKSILKKYPKRQASLHKGQCGRIGVIAGSKTMLGAAVLTARAALRMGAGLVYLFTIKEAAPILNAIYPEIIVIPLSSDILTDSNAPLIKQEIRSNRINTLAIGPGLGLNKSTKKCVNRIIDYASENAIPTVIDADALNALCLTRLKGLKSDNFILTPHPGEFENLFNAQYQINKREALAESVSKEYQQVVVLKGNETIIASRNNVWVNPTGNSGMATAGMGDVLTGILAALCGQGIQLIDAAALGVYLHGLVGDYVYQEKGNGLIASDIIENLAKVFKNEYI